MAGRLAAALIAAALIAWRGLHDARALLLLYGPASRCERERLAIEAERRRIAWELHDSAKQRLHAAHLLVSSLEDRVGNGLTMTVQRAAVELESAAADMDVLLDYHLPRGDGLQLCHRIKRARPAPRVAVFSAYAGPDLVVPARLAGADALLGKGMGARELFEALRRIHPGEDLLGEAPPGVLGQTVARIPDEHRAAIGMLRERTRRTTGRSSGWRDSYSPSTSTASAGPTRRIMAGQLAPPMRIVAGRPAIRFCSHCARGPKPDITTASRSSGRQASTSSTVRWRRPVRRPSWTSSRNRWPSSRSPCTSRMTSGTRSAQLPTRSRTGLHATPAAPRRFAG